jgi:hypothetical protein
MYHSFLNNVEDSRKSETSFFYKMMNPTQYNKVNGNLNGHVEAADVCKVIHDFYSKLYNIDESVAGNIPEKLSNYYPNLNLSRFSIIDEISLDELQLLPVSALSKSC